MRIEWDKADLSETLSLGPLNLPLSGQDVVNLLTFREMAEKQGYVVTPVVNVAHAVLTITAKRTRARRVS